jgi:cobalt transporter subunit CbtA
MFRAILLSAGVAGLLAALALTLLQAVWITPLILQAETYENGEAAAPAATHEHAHDHDHAHAIEATAADHDHGHDHGDGWAPADGVERTFFTLISNVVMGFAYALMLAGIYTLWRQPKNAAQGLLFGLAGFAVFFAAPGLGLPPELPGTEAADLGQRQLWWIGTASTTAVGLALLFVQKNIWLRALGVAILLMPHIIGAPHPAVEGGLAPEELQKHFRLATVVGNAVFWLLLGAISAAAIRRFSSPQTAS